MGSTMTMMARQHLALSPRLQKAMSLLQLSSLEFDETLREAAASNPFLEEFEAALEQDSYAFERPVGGAAQMEVLERLPDRVGLQDHLRQQLYGSRCTQRQVVAAELVIDSLDDDGYLREEVPSRAVKPPLTDEEIELAVRLVRSFEPAGVGARSLVDCLRLQIDADPEQTPVHGLARGIIEKHLDLLAHHDFRVLEQRLDCGTAALHEALSLIRHLDPSPALSRAPTRPDYLVPDVVVRKHGDRFVALDNPALRPRAGLNQRYIQMFRQCRRGEHPAMAGQLHEARWLLRNLRQRHDTILRVASCIVARQQAFFAIGETGLRPLLARDVARELGCHESTVSRAAAQKYMATPQGCFEFRHFFTRELATTQGTCSAGAVRDLIRELIEAEPADAPLSDIEIASRLQDRGIRIARRTVNKYRRMLKLPPVEFRRSVSAVRSALPA